MEGAAPWSGEDPHHNPQPGGPTLGPTLGKKARVTSEFENQGLCQKEPKGYRKQVSALKGPAHLLQTPVHRQQFEICLGHT